MRSSSQKDIIRKEIADYNSIDLSIIASALGRACKASSDLGRVCLPTYVLSRYGTAASLFSEERIRAEQHADGGWTDIIETALLTAICKARHALKKCHSAGLSWILKSRNADGGWGKTERDISRILVTGLVLYLLPELADDAAAAWLVGEWGKDMHQETRLTYKGAFFLMGLSVSGVRSDSYPLIGETYRFLSDEQNEDGGFGPWKNHPIGSEPWSTGIVLLGLLSYPELVKKDVVERAVEWLERTQLSNGLWAYHYIEEGSAYAYWGLVEALKFLSKASP